MSDEADALVVGSGPNGLAGAVVLAAAGLRVIVLEGAPTAGGGCRTEELTLPGFLHDVCSAAHPLAVASPFFRRFDLAARGVRLLQPELAFAHPLGGDRAVAAGASVDETAASLGRDASRYRRLFGPIVRHEKAIVDAVLSSMRAVPPHPLVPAGFALERCSLRFRHRRALFDRRGAVVAGRCRRARHDAADRRPPAALA